MNKVRSLAVALCLVAGMAAVAFAGGEFDDFLRNINLKAEADLGGFKANLSAQFNVPLPQVELVLKTVEKPADAYMCFRVGEVAKKPTELVVKEYQANKGKGWGQIAKNLGIKPGSKEFHELKKGGPGAGDDDAKGKGKGKGKGKNK